MLSLFAIVSIFIMGDTKAGVSLAEQKLAQSQNKSLSKVELAKAHFIDQNQEMAFKVFIEALDELPPPPPEMPITPDELVAYNDALHLYLNHRPEEAKIFGKKIRDQFLPLVIKHPEWTKLPFLVAIADANLSEFEHFFDLFYHAYSHDKRHFLALKTKAILHIKLFERAKTPGDKERERVKILQYIKEAEIANPEDFSLYRLEIAYAMPDNKASTKMQVLNKILTLSIIPSRVDTLYFLKLAKDSDEPSLIKKWFSAANKWYPGSRSIQQLEENGNQNAR